MIARSVFAGCKQEPRACAESLFFWRRPSFQANLPELLCYFAHRYSVLWVFFQHPFNQLLDQVVHGDFFLDLCDLSHDDRIASNVIEFLLCYKVRLDSHAEEKLVENNSK